MTWRDELRTAARVNLLAVQDGDPSLAQFVALAQQRRWTALADAVRRDLPYQFDGPWQHHVTSWATARARGYAACADASALIGAVLVASGVRPVWFCTERLPHVPHYSHLRILVGRVPVDPYASQRLEASCTDIEDAVALVAG